MTSICKGQKMKGGKTSSGPSPMEGAMTQNLLGMAAFKANEDIFKVFTVTEDVGVPKKGMSAEYTLKGVSEGGMTVSIFVPSSFLTKNGKLAIREMGVVGRRLAVSPQMVSVKRTSWQGHAGGGGCMATGTVIQTDYIVAAVLD